MKRRTLLGTAPLAALGLAGCLGGGPGGDPGDGGSDGGDPGSGDPDDSPSPTQTPARADWNPGPEFERVPVGDRDAVPFPDANRPVEVLVWNDGDARTIGVTVETGDGATPLDRAFDAPGDGTLAVELRQPGDYDVRVSVGEEAASFDVDRAAFDCNDREERVAVRADGGVDRSTVATEMGCPPPAVTEATFDAADGDCGGEHAATVSFREPDVVVEGTLAVPTPCYRAELAEATYDADELRVTVAAVDPPADTACVECVGSVPYEARATVEHEFPGRVVVVHDGLGDRTEVASVEL